MIKYIVTWCLLNWSAAPCPTEIIMDEFGRKAIVQTPAEVCLKKKKNCRHTKVFTSKTSATIFFNKARSQNDIEMVFLKKITGVDTVLLMVDSLEKQYEPIIIK